MLANNYRRIQKTSNIYIKFIIKQSYRNPNNFGSHNDMKGKKEIRKRIPISTNKKTIISLLNSNIETFAIGLATNKTCPTGGVIKPKVALRINITPKCIGWNPNLTDKGARIGASISIKGGVSIKVPAINTITFTKIIKVKGVLCLNNPPIISPILFIANTHEKRLDVATIIITIEVVIAVCNSILGTSDNLTVRKKKTLKKNA